MSELNLITSLRAIEDGGSDSYKSEDVDSVCGNAADELCRLHAQLSDARAALRSIRANANVHTASLALATMPMIFDIATRAYRQLTNNDPEA